MIAIYCSQGVAEFTDGEWQVYLVLQDYYEVAAYNGEHRLYLHDTNNLSENDLGSERKIHYPALYKHFKGSCYAVMGVSKPVTINAAVDSNKLTKTLYCMHTETGTNFLVLEFKNATGFYHSISEFNEELVIYKSLDDDKGIYARPIDMFLGLTDKEKYPDATQTYRFEKV